MNSYSIVLLASVAANAWLVGLLALRARRRIPRTSLIAALALFSVPAAVHTGRVEGVMGPSWEPAAFGAFVLAHGAVASFAILFLHGEPLLRRLPPVGAILLGGLLLTIAGILGAWRASDAFQPTTDLGQVILNAYLVACLAVALAESLATWRQSSVLRTEAFYLIAGTISLIVAGPIYGFELDVLGFTDLLGSNPAVPLAGVFFTFALFRSNPMPFRGRGWEGPVRIPWTTPPGAYFLRETRPKYAQSMFLAATDGPVLAILSEPEAHAPDLAGAETARIPAGDRAASVLAATASEFFSRNPKGTILINDYSYLVTHAGPLGASEAITRTVRGMPSSARLVLALSKTTNEELAPLEKVPASRISPPDVEAELDGILRSHLGASADQLRRAAIARGKRVEDLSMSDVPHLRDFVLASLSDLRSPADEAAQAGWRRVSEAIASDLEAFWRTPPTDARERVVSPPERARAAPTEDFQLVRAAEVLGPQPTKRATRTTSIPLGAAVQDAFLGSLGPAGEPVFRRVLGGLRKESSALVPEDLPRVATLAEEALTDLGGAIDVDEARRDLLERFRRLKIRLEGLSREAR